MPEAGTPGRRPGKLIATTCLSLECHIARWRYCITTSGAGGRVPADYGAATDAMRRSDISRGTSHPPGWRRTLIPSRMIDAGTAATRPYGGGVHGHGHSHDGAALRTA